MTSRKSKGLGRGLDAFFGDSLGDELIADDAGSRIEEVDLESLHPGKFQPRTQIDDASLEELAASIREQGLISPIIVRPIGGANYEIIAGERRFRAAAKAGLDKVPVIIRDVDDRRALAMALIENIQREDLNPLDVAAGIERLIEEFGLTHEEAAAAIGRSRSATTNFLRLLSLAEEVKAMLLEGDLEMGHARALLPLSAGDQILAAKTVAARRLSVRQTEELVKRLLAQDSEEEKTEEPADPDRAALEESLSDYLGAVVKIRASRRGKGKVVIEFSSLDQFDGILNLIGPRRKANR